MSDDKVEAKHDNDLEAVKAHAPGLVDGDDAVMPSFIEVLGYLKMSEAIGLEAVIEKQKEMYKRFVSEQKIKNSPTQFIGYIVPLDSYMPLPEPYGANVVYPDDKDDVLRASLVSINSTPMTITADGNEMKVRLSVMCVALGDHKVTGKTIDEHGKADSLFNIYESALDIANDVIAAYKLTPNRHNHDLRPVTALNRPSTVEVVRFDIDKPGILELEPVSIHKNALISTMHARKMEEKELANFRNIHVMLSGQMHLEGVLLSKIYQAIDARCVGQETYSVVLADTYTEHMLRYLLFQILLTELSPDDAGKTIEDIRSIDKLIRALARKLQLSQNELKSKIEFSEWWAKCRRARNSITHVFLDQKLTQENAQAAINATIAMVDKLIAITETKYDFPENVSTLLHSVRWYQQTRQGSPNEPTNTTAN